MQTPLRWLLAIVAVAAGLFFIVMSFGEGVIGGTVGSWADILIGVILVIVGLVLRPR